MTDTESAFWQAIEADPTDHLVRGVYADWLLEHGREDEAAAVRATVGKMPVKIGDYRIPSGISYSFALCWAQKERRESVVKRVWAKLGGKVPEHHPSWKDYPTFRAAMLDLIRAWVAVHREGVTCG